jgi:cytosine/adenosine deaminase-related metal-dependent hydrolase
MASYRKISATYLFPTNRPPIKNGLLILNREGVVVDVVDRGDDFSELEGVEHYSGILCPGFINAHCHLELSYLKGQIETCTDLADFLSQLFHKRLLMPEPDLAFARQADLAMYKNGIVAVGDIANSSFSLEVKERSKMFYHTFIEVFGFLPQRAPRAMEYAQFVAQLYRSSKQQFSITPHAPYSTSSELFEMVKKNTLFSKSIWSVHHQESADENQLFHYKKGKLLQHYQNTLNVDTDFWQPTGKSSTESVIPFVPTDAKLLLVHNLFMGNAEIHWLKENRSAEDTYLVTCPKSNLFIEKQLPDYASWLAAGFPICVGTDSLASNNSLSVFEELKVIGANCESISIENLLNWACINGATALDIDDWAGSFDKGKKPGVNLISGVDFKTMRLSANAKVKRLM